MKLRWEEPKAVGAELGRLSMVVEEAVVPQQVVGKPVSVVYTLTLLVALRVVVSSA